MLHYVLLGASVAASYSFAVFVIATLFIQVLNRKPSPHPKQVPEHRLAFAVVWTLILATQVVMGWKLFATTEGSLSVVHILIASVIALGYAFMLLGQFLILHKLFEVSELEPLPVPAPQVSEVTHT